MTGSAHQLNNPTKQEIEMPQDTDKEGNSILYWIMLGIMFAAFLAVAVS
jgi:hypothetical protein